MWGRNGEPRSNRRTAEGRTHLYAWPSPREGKGLGCLALRYPAHAWGAATQPPLCLSRASSAPHVWRGEGWRRGVGGRTPKLRAYTAGPSAFWSALVASPSSPSSRNLGLGLRCRGRLASAGLASACAAHPPARIRQRERERERAARCCERAWCGGHIERRAARCCERAWCDGYIERRAARCCERAWCGGYIERRGGAVR